MMPFQTFFYPGYKPTQNPLRSCISPGHTNEILHGIDVFHKWTLWHGDEARMLFSRSILVSNHQTDMFLCFIFAKIAK